MMRIPKGFTVKELYPAYPTIIVSELFNMKFYIKNVGWHSFEKK